MSAATDNRNDGGLGAGLRPHELFMGWSGPIAASAKLPNGTIAGATSLKPGTAINSFATGQGYIPLGFVDAGWDNTGGLQGAHQIAVNQRTGNLVDLNAGGGSAIAAADAMKPVYLVDNQTCSKLSSDGEPGGIILGLDPGTGRPVVGIGPLFIAMALAFQNGAQSGEQALSGAGAVNVTQRTTKLTSTGVGNALTLANGLYAGQRKTIVHEVDGGSAVLTPATPLHFATYTFTNVHDWLELQWTGAAWIIVGYGGGTIA